MEIREADCCHNCKHFLCEKWECFGDCKPHPEFNKIGIFFHNICDDFEKRTGDMALKEHND